MRVAPQNRVDARHAAGHFQINIHAVVAKQHHGLRAFGTSLIYGVLHLVFTNAECPVGR